MDEHIRYPEDHWIRSDDPHKALEAYKEQQSKAYSRRKIAYVKELLGNLKGKRFLDFGCGGGLFTVYAAQQGAAEVVAMDAEASVLATAAYHTEVEGVKGCCKFVRSAEFPRLLTNRKFDVVLIKDVIEHIADDEEMLSRAAESLVPGGLLVLSTQNWLSLNYAIEGGYQRFVLGNTKWMGWDETHLRFYSTRQLGKKLRKAGFRVKKKRSVYLVPYKLQRPSWISGNGKYIRLDTLSWVDRALGAVFPFNSLGWNIIMSAETSSLLTTKTKVADSVESLALIPT